MANDYKTVPIDDVFNSMAPERQARVKARAHALIAEELTLRDLRKARNLTQKAIARKLKMGQDGVSRVEQRTDMHLSTLRGYIEAMGGHLNLVAEFPDRPPVTIKEIGDLEAEPEAPRRRRTKAEAHA